MNKEIEKRIDGIIDMRRILWNAFLLISAGLASILLDFNTPAKIGLFIVGTVIWCTIVIIIYNVNNELETLYNKLKD